MASALFLCSEVATAAKSSYLDVYPRVLALVYSSPKNMHFREHVLHECLSSPPWLDRHCQDLNVEKVHAAKHSKMRCTNGLGSQYMSSMSIAKYADACFSIHWKLPSQSDAAYQVDCSILYQGQHTSSRRLWVHSHSGTCTTRPNALGKRTCA